MATQVHGADIDAVPDDMLDDVSDVVAMHGPFKLTRTGAVATRDPTFDEFEAAMKWVREVGKASPFWYGDLLAYGEGRFGEMASQIMEAEDIKYGTLANEAYVARRVPLSRRREKLPFALHQEVAPLSPAEQTQWLDKCEAEELTQKQLRHLIKVEKAQREQRPIELLLEVSCSDVEDQTQLADRLQLEGRSVKALSRELFTT